jgi:hypothetical protein
VEFTNQYFFSCQPCSPIHVPSVPNSRRENKTSLSAWVDKELADEIKEMHQKHKELFPTLSEFLEYIWEDWLTTKAAGTRGAIGSSQRRANRRKL